MIAADQALAALASACRRSGPASACSASPTTAGRSRCSTTAGPVTAQDCCHHRRALVGRAARAASASPCPASRRSSKSAYLTRPDRRPDRQPHGGTPPIFICHGDQAPYGLPVPGSPLVKIGIHPSGPATDPDAQQQSRSERCSAADRVARQYLPGYEPEPATTERCIYDNSPDEDFILDRTRERGDRLRNFRARFQVRAAVRRVARTAGGRAGPVRTGRCRRRDSR